MVLQKLVAPKVRSCMDPFLDLIHLLRPRATLWRRADGAGRWGVSFPKRDDLLFCWVQRGECQLIRPMLAPIHLRQDDFVLVRTTTPFTLTSDPSVEPEDIATTEAITQDTGLKLGEGTDSPVTLRGGRFVFDTANENLLTGLASITGSCRRQRHIRMACALSAEDE